ncbi:hypothetical protein [Cellulosimicrobium arenosum]|uniref:Uncharacterized protein n=1 Tax=Cellulosimicrobium arenosum TaxID=2708133 RepID=A0A927G678_9MICO|nr:hypothetical protein [Cellulosimicrobium arenosum]MBD8077699.1 hypothetical protein [Cellulosimicrobium arenosum]
MTVSRLVYTVEIVGTDYRVSPEEGMVTLDESWTPYAQAGVTIPLPSDPAILDALDPRLGARVRITMSQRFGSAFTIADLTAGSGSSTAAWTADLNGAPLSEWTGRYSSPFNSTGSRASRTRRLDLGVRARSVNYERGTVDIDLASDEALLLDLARVDTTTAFPVTSTVYGAVALVLSAIGATAALEVPDAALEADSAGWEPGQVAWDYVKPLVDAAGMRLYCDEGRDWHLTKPLYPTGQALTFSGSNAKFLQDDISRDEQWFDAVVVTYRWTNSAGDEQVRYDTAQDGEATRVKSLTYDRRYPGPGGARSILDRARGRGRIESILSVANPEATPGQALTVNLDDAPIQTGITTNVSWNFGADEMRVRSRDLTDTPESAWVLMPLGWAWEDIPEGMSWDELEWTNEEEEG